MEKKIGRNDRCHCGSNQKYKKCHEQLDKQQRARLEACDGDERAFAQQPLESLELGSKYEPVAGLSPLNKKLIDEALRVNAKVAAGVPLEQWEKIFRDLLY